MAKSSGLGQQYFHHGVDLSGDVGSASAINFMIAFLAVTGINKSAFERIHGLRDGNIDFQSHFNPSASQAHPTLSALPSTDVITCWLTGIVVGDPVAMLVAKQANYAGTRAADGGLSFAVQALANAYGLLWGHNYTAGKVSIASEAAGGATGTAIDGGTYGSAVSITGASAANPTVVTATAHGLVTGDSIVITGSDKAPLNTNWTVTVVNANTFTVPLDLTSGAATGGSFLKTSTNFGGVMVVELFALASGTITVRMSDSGDNVSFQQLNGSSVAIAAASAPTAAVDETDANVTIRRYVRMGAGATAFTNADVFVGFRRYMTNQA